MEALKIEIMATSDFFNTMGKRLHILRKDRGITQTEMAARMGQYGQEVNSSYLSQIERGEKVPSLAVFEAMVKVLNASADYLLLLSDDPELPEDTDADLAWSPTTNAIANAVDKWPEAARQVLLAAVRAMTPFVATDEKDPDAGSTVTDIGDQSYLYGRLTNGSANQGNEQPQTRSKRKSRR